MESVPEVAGLDWLTKNKMENSGMESVPEVAGLDWLTKNKMENSFALCLRSTSLNKQLSIVRV